MKRSAKIVVGLGYGDEGKGLVTDFLCHSSPKPLVVRFNGGHQAGHTVKTIDGNTHVFSCIGSGAFRQAPTFWSEYCTFSPAYFLYEVGSLSFAPKMLVDVKCPVTTHYDVLFNRFLENSRGIDRLGSCGVGFGATVERHFVSRIQFSVSDLSHRRTALSKLREIRAYYSGFFESITGVSFNQFDHDNEDERFLEDINELREMETGGNIRFVSDYVDIDNMEFDTVIFEGAQGIMLDQSFGFKPYITRSNTTSRNALRLVEKIRCFSECALSIFYVTRSYLTRHGGGPFQEFPDWYKLKNTLCETNTENEYQGRFRKGFLNLDLMRYALDSDLKYSGNVPKNLVITCLDQLPDERIYFSQSNIIKSTGYKSFPSLLGVKFQQCLVSYSPYAEYLIHM